MKRIYHHYSLWEEYPAGLWRAEASLFSPSVALELMKDTQRWAEAMLKVIKEWPYSCEQNLSHSQHNRLAWLGQAAVCLEVGQPSTVTRQAWWQLTEEEKDAANAAATMAIHAWEKDHA